MKKFNINERVLIQITEDGWKHLSSTVGMDYVVHCILIKEKIIDGEKWYNLQAHQVIELFGSASWSSNSSPIKTNILIP